MSDPVQEKIKSIREAANTAYYGDDGKKVKLFASFPESLKNRFNVSIILEKSESLTKDLSWEMEYARVQALMAGVDYPFHSTILECVWEGSGEDQPKVFKELKIEVSPLLKGWRLEALPFSKLVCDDGGSTLLMSPCIPLPVCELREELSILYVKHGLKPLPLDNIFHSTVQRLKDVPSNTPEALELHLTLIVRTSLREPIVMKGLYAGPVWDLLHTRPE